MLRRGESVVFFVKCTNGGGEEKRCRLLLQLKNYQNVLLVKTNKTMYVYGFCRLYCTQGTTHFIIVFLPSYRLRNHQGDVENLSFRH